MSITNLLSQGIGGIASSGSQLYSAASGADLTSSMAGVKRDMDKTAIETAKMNAQFQRDKAISDAYLQAGSAASSLKVSYQ